jgi:hypothetical protein
MANRLFPLTGKAILDAFGFLSADIKVSLIDTYDYTYSDGHDFFNDLAGVVASSAALSGKSTTDGVFDAGDVTLSTVSGDESEALILWKDTGNTATSTVIFYWDTGVTGLPVQPIGGDVIIQWNVNGILEIAM